jgi:hypothetical protein|tara:strand:- start:504 stop:680 length:177 start_codon:yes stop_codon:yes gene_type:complete
LIVVLIADRRKRFGPVLQWNLERETLTTGLFVMTATSNEIPYHTYSIDEKFANKTFIN